MKWLDRDGRVDPRVQFWICLALADLFLFEGLGDFFLSPHLLNRFIAIVQILAAPGWLYGAWCGFARYRHRKQSLFVLDRRLGTPPPAEYSVEASNTHPGCYAVAAIDSNDGGEMYRALFLGPNSREHAEEFADWKNTLEALRSRKVRAS